MLTNCADSDSQTNSEPDNVVPEIDLKDLAPQPSIRDWCPETSATSSKRRSLTGSIKKTAVQITAENVAAQITALEAMLSKAGGDAKKLAPNQVKNMQAALKKLRRRPKDKLSAACVRSLLEIARE